MEEDIKILQKFIISYKKEIGNHCLNCPSDEDIKALENLTKGYRELEEENRIFALAGSNIALKLHVEKNYIPKSKAKEKIKELKTIIKQINEENPVEDTSQYRYVIEILQEFMEGK